MAEIGEPLLFGIPEGTIQQFLNERGLDLVTHWRRDQLAERYLVRSDGRIHGRPFESGGIAHAKVAGG